MVGTPNMGSCNPYYMWEGGDPLLLDKLVSWGVWKGNFYWNTTEANYEEVSGNVNSWNHEKIWHYYTGEKGCFGYDKGSSLLSLKQLLPTYPFLGYISKPLEKEKNDALYDLNEGKYSSNKSRMGSAPDKVRTGIFLGTGQKTIQTIAVDKGSDCLYRDGVPKKKNGGATTTTEGDGTVLETSAELPFKEGWAYIRSEVNCAHAGLIKLYAPTLVKFIEGKLDAGGEVSVADKKPAATEEPAGNTLSVAVRGRAQPYLISPAGGGVGINPTSGLREVKIAGATVSTAPDASALRIEGCADGEYVLQAKGIHVEDFALNIGFSGSEETATLRKIAFSHGEVLTYHLIVDSADEEKLKLTENPLPPSELSCTAVENDGLKTRLQWTASPSADVTSYNVYTRETTQPYFSQLGTTSEPQYDTGHSWASDSAVVTRTYAVTAVLADGSESFFSNSAQNNDRDHDGLIDEQESLLGTGVNNPDTDGEGLMDGYEIMRGTKPLVQDTDGDTYSDYVEIEAGSDPLDPESIPCTEPTVTTTVPTGIASTAATGGGNVTSDGGTTVTTRGVCWSTAAGPTISDHSVLSGSGTGGFTATITGLTENTTYYVRAYATNSAGTAYGENRSFKTLTTAGCPACSGSTPTVQGETFKQGTDCTCTGANSLTIGPDVVVESGARATFKSDHIIVKSKVEAKEGSVVKMGR